MAGNLIVRIFAIAFGLLLAWLAAGMFLAAGLYSGLFRPFFAELDLSAQEVDVLTIIVVTVLGIVQALSLAAIAFAPSALAVLAAELFRWRGLVINLVLGGIVGLATGWLALRGSELQAIAQGNLSQGAALVLLATGFCGGFVYWLVAGRNSGNWR